jgi:hypothetical protein
MSPSPQFSLPEGRGAPGRESDRPPRRGDAGDQLAGPKQAGSPSSSVG